MSDFYSNNYDIGLNSEPSYYSSDDHIVHCKSCDLFFDSSNWIGDACEDCTIMDDNYANNL